MGGVIFINDKGRFISYVREAGDMGKSIKEAGGAHPVSHSENTGWH